MGGWKKGDKVRHIETGKIVEVYSYKPTHRTRGRTSGSMFFSSQIGFTFLRDDTEIWDLISNYEIVERVTDTNMANENSIKMTLTDGTVLEGTAEELKRFSDILNGEEAQEEQAQELAVGDYARVSGRTFCGDIGEGTIVEICGELVSDGPLRIDLLDGSDFDFIYSSRLVKVELTDEELTFLKLGREPGEYKVGDIFKTEYYGLQEVSEVRECSRHSIRYVGRSGNSEGMMPGGCTLVTPVENRVDIDKGETCGN